MYCCQVPWPGRLANEKPTTRCPFLNLLEFAAGRSIIPKPIAQSHPDELGKLQQIFQLRLLNVPLLLLQS